MKVLKKNNDLNNFEFENSSVTNENKNVFDEIKIYPNKKKLLKVLKFLNKNLNFKNTNIELYKLLNGISFNFKPEFVVFHNDMIHDQRNILMTVIALEKNSNIKHMSTVSKDYFKNFDNLFFVLIFDNTLKPHLFIRQENNDNTDILYVDHKQIKPFN